MTNDSFQLKWAPQKATCENDGHIPLKELTIPENKVLPVQSKRDLTVDSDVKVVKKSNIQVNRMAILLIRFTG